MSAPAIAQDPTPSPTATTPPPSAPTTPTGKALAQAKKDNRRVEIEPLRSESATYYANPDGKTVRMEMHTQPIRVKDADGKGFTSIDTTLVEADGSIKPKAAKGDLVLSAGRNKTLLKSRTADATAKIATPSALPEPKLNGSTATYPDAYGKGRDLVVTANPTGFRQQITIAERPTGPVSFRVPVDLPSGLSFKKNAADQPLIVSKDGKTLTEVRPTLLQDATASDAGAPIDAGKIGKAAVTLGEDGKTLVFTPDTAFLADPAVTYPVTMTAAADDWWETDTSESNGMDTFINDVDYQDSWAGFTLDRILAGKSYASNVAKRWRSYLKFPNVPDEFAGSTVENADLILWNHLSNDCGPQVGSGITARQITSFWDETSLHWDDQPSVTNVGADTEYGAYSPDCSGSMAYEWDLIHSVDDIVQAWVDGETNYGIRLTAGSESDVRNWRRYRTDEAGGCTTAPREECKGTLHPPILTVDFEPVAEPVVETIHYTYTGPKRTTPPTYEEALAMQVKTETSPTLPGVSDEQGEALEREATNPYYIGPEALLPLVDEADETNYGPDPDRYDLSDPPADETPPSVVDVSPHPDAQKIPIDTKITLAFSEPIWDLEVSLKDNVGAAVNGTITSDDPREVMTFTPSTPLIPGHAYQVVASGAVDAYGNRMSDHPWSFVTKLPTAGHWTFNEGTGGTAADSSGRQLDATLNDTAAWVAGKDGNAVSNVPSQARIATSASAARQGKAVEVVDETTATSITYAQPDGKTFKTEVAAGPVRTRQGGGWMAIDTTLAEQGGKLRPKAIAEGAVVELSAGGTNPFVKMSADGKSYALRWPMPLPKPTVKGSVATYTDAAGVGADLVVTALPTGFRHEVVLRQRPAKQVELRIGVEDEGLTLSEGKGGRLLLRGKDKKLMAAGTRPIVSDGSGKDRPASVKRGQAGTDVVTKDGRTELVVKPDQTFLADADTTYPVRVAAAVTLPLGADIDVSSDNLPALPDNPYMMAGTMTGGTKTRVHLRFDTAGLQGSTVTDATLSMNTIDSHDCGAALANGIQVARLTGAWDPDNLYWANKPAHTTEDASTNFKGVNWECDTYPDSMDWNVTGIAQDWAGGAANHGLVLKSPGEANIDNYRVFTSSEDTDFNLPPKLTITTSGPASQPAVSAPAITPAHTVDGTTVTTSLTPQLVATVADPAGGNLTGQFEVEHDPATTGQGSGQIWTGASPEVTSGGQATVSVPTGMLADGWKIRWRARAANASASTTSAWTDWQTATVDVPNPTVGAFQVTPSQVVDGITVTTSLTPALRTMVTDPTAQPLRAEFEVEHDPSATGQGNGQIWTGATDNVTSGTQASLTIPDGKLTDGWKVRWRARAVNTATTVGSPWSSWQALTVDVPDPVSEPAVAALQITPSEQVDGTTVTPTRTPSLLAQVSDPAGKPLRAEAELEHDPAAPDGQGTGQIWTGNADNVPTGTQASIAVPADTLTDGWKVRWRARAVSATAASAWSDWQSFTVSLPKPTATGLTITPSKVVDGVTVTTTVTPILQATLIHPAGQALRAEAEIEHDPAATGQGTGQIWTGNITDVASGTQASIAVPADKLADGWKVRWRLRPVAIDASSDWSDWQQVTVDVTQPGEEPLARTAGPVIRTDQSFTAAAWLRWSDKDSDYTVLEQRGTHQAPFRLGNTAERGLVFTFTSADAADSAVEGVLSDVEPPVGEWFHLTGVYDATAKTASLYLNGTLVKTMPVATPAWNSDGPVTLGTQMIGDLDEVRVYQTVLMASQITTLAGISNAVNASLSVPITTADQGTLDSPVRKIPSAESISSNSVTTQDDPFPYFKYDHHSLGSCRAEAEAESPDDDDNIWTSLRPYSGCIVAWHGVSQWVPISGQVGQPARAKRVRSIIKNGRRVTQDADGDIVFRSTMVVNTYLGNRFGTGVVPSQDGVTGQKPRDISAWISIDQIDWDDIVDTEMKLEVTPVSGVPSSSCITKFGQNRTSLLSEWRAQGTQFYSFESYPIQWFGRGQHCSIRPWVQFPYVASGPDDGVGALPTHVPLWDRKIAAGTSSILKRDNALSAKCDSRASGPGGELKNTSEEKRVRYIGACIFPKAARIYVMKKDHSKMGLVSQHVGDAFSNPSDTKPTQLSPVKQIPGNWNAPKGTPQRAHLTKLYSGQKAPDGRTWSSKHESEKNKVCKLYFPNSAQEGKQCDEYPFASTEQGAGLGDGNFSIRALLQGHNSSDGWHKAVFYARYRVFGASPFWVSVE